MNGMERNNEGILRETVLSRIMRNAYSAHILVPAFNIAYLPMVEPVVEILKELDCFGLVEVARPDIEKFGAKSLSAVKQEYRKYADRAYVRLHEDHVPVIDEDGEQVEWEKMIVEALDLGFDSVMIDGSRLSLEENARVTRRVVDLAHARGCPVEAELGAVFGHEKAPLPPYEDLYRSGKGFTDPEEATEFVKNTDVDWLSVAIGNIHGAISGVAKDQKKVNARLNIRHLQKIVSTTNVPIVLHGGSGIRQKSVLDAVDNGVTKINIGTQIRQKYESGLREKGSIEAAQEHMSQEMTDLIRNYFRIQGSASKLASLIKDPPKGTVA
jgi:ketose-bisphosphate aldolase